MPSALAALRINKRSWRWASLPALLLGALDISGCSLSNTTVDACASDAACTAGFGLGSTCSDGYCTEPAVCSTGHDCRARFGGGACVAGSCRSTLPLPVEAGWDTNCPAEYFEPADLASLPLSGPDAPIIVGSVLSIGDPFDQAQSKAARLAVREINRTGGLEAGRKLALVCCDNGGPNNDSDGVVREAYNQAALDYLSGTLGVPAIVGPFSSTDALTLTNHVLNRRYPTVLISPSATSPQLSAQPDRLNPTDPYGLLWRTCASDQLQGEVLASYIPATDVPAVVFIQDPYGQGLVNVFIDARAGDSLLFPYSSDTDLATLAQAVASANPTSVLIIAVVASDTVALLTEMANTTLATKQFYLTDGSKDGEQLLDPSLPAAVQDIVRNALGTAPASPSGTAFDLFDAQLRSAFGLGASDTAYLANTYDATYMVGYGLVHAAYGASTYDGREVAMGLASLSSGATVVVGSTTWANAKSGLTSGSRTIDIEGTSGHLDFDASTGEATGPIEIWSVEPDLSGFVTVQVIYP